MEEFKVDFSELDRLLNLMGGSKVDFKLPDSIKLPEIVDISIKLEEGLEIDITKLEIVGGVYSYEGEQLVVHIYRTYKIIDEVKDTPEKNVRYHLRDCRTIKRMKEIEKFDERYIGTNNTSGIFKVEVYTKESKKKSKPIFLPLIIIVLPSTYPVPPATIFWT